MTENHKIQIQELNKLCQVKLAPSDIHGVGIFAMRDINAGERIYANVMPMLFSVPHKKFGELRTEVAEHLIGQFPQIVNGSRFWYPTTNIQAWMNHSDDPNYDAVKDVTLRNIKEGEEVTEDYKKIDGWEKVFDWLK